MRRALINRQEREDREGKKKKNFVYFVSFVFGGLCLSFGFFRASKWD